ncbi:hypothetical protein Emed_007321 [Eimeria media]
MPGGAPRCGGAPRGAPLSVLRRRERQGKTQQGRQRRQQGGETGKRGNSLRQDLLPQHSNNNSSKSSSSSSSSRRSSSSSSSSSSMHAVSAEQRLESAFICRGPHRGPLADAAAALSLLTQLFELDGTRHAS